MDYIGTVEEVQELIKMDTHFLVESTIKEVVNWE